jgi:hypothetical protein
LGFVQARSTRCGRLDTLAEAGFFALNLWVACPRCGLQMGPQRVFYDNYAYVCEPCDCTILLAEMIPDDIRPKLPRWARARVLAPAKQYSGNGIILSGR